MAVGKHYTQDSTGPRSKQGMGLAGGCSWGWAVAVGKGAVVVSWQRSGMADALLVAGFVAVGTACCCYLVDAARLVSTLKATLRRLAAAAAAAAVGTAAHGPEEGLAAVEVHRAARHMYSDLLEESRKQKFLVPGDGHKWTEVGDGQADIAPMAAAAAAVVVAAGTAYCLLESGCVDQEIARFGGSPAQGLRRSNLVH